MGPLIQPISYFSILHIEEACETNIQTSPLSELDLPPLLQTDELPAHE